MFWSVIMSKLATVVHKKKEKEIAVDIWKKSTDESSSFFVPPGLKTSNLLRIEHTDKHTKHTHPRYLHCNNVHSETTLPQLIGSVCFVFLNWPFVWQDTTVLYIYIYIHFSLYIFLCVFVKCVCLCVCVWPGCSIRSLQWRRARETAFELFNIPHYSLPSSQKSHTWSREHTHTHSQTRMHAHAHAAPENPIFSAEMKKKA